MAKKERNQGSVGRARAKRGTSSTSESMNDPVVSSFARSRGPRWMSEVPREFINRDMQVSVGAAPAVEPTRPVPRPVRGGMKSSLVPTPRPDDLMERRKAADSADAAYRASRREAEDIEMGREMRGYAGGGMVKGYEAGGVVRGCKAGQMSGKGFSGNY